MLYYICKMFKLIILYFIIWEALIMNATVLIGILTTIIEIILVFSVIRTTENTREMKETLDEIKRALADKNSPLLKKISKPAQVSSNESWVCDCGTRNNNTNTCTTCGAKKV